MVFSSIESEVRLVFNSGMTRPIESRRQALIRLKDVLVRREKDVMKALRQDLGKCDFESKISETGFIISEINYHLKHMDDWAKEVVGVPPLLAQPAKTRLVPCPRGVVLVLAPWNYPFMLSLAPLIGAVTAGNAVVLKPSELAPHTADVISEIVSEVFPENQVRCVLGGEDVASELLRHPFDHFFFTGSKRVGRIVAQAALDHLSTFTLELGGKSPCIIDDTANTVHTARRIAWGKSLNAGQTCVAPDFLLVHESVHDKIVESIIEEWRGFYGTDPERSPDYGRIINVDQFDRLEQLLESTKGRIIGGGRSRVSRFFEPTIVTDVELGDPLMANEIFGPILPVIRWREETELSHVINKNPDPLALYIFTERKDFSERLLSSVSFGGACVNHIALHLGCPDLPFGGKKTSGVGRYHGRYGFETFTHYKSVVEASSLFDVRLKYPPYGKIDSLLKWFYL